MKKYIQPNIKVQHLEVEELMAASDPSLNNQHSGSDQLAKPFFDEETDDETATTIPSVWDEED